MSDPGGKLPDERMRSQDDGQDDMMDSRDDGVTGVSEPGPRVSHVGA